MAQPSSRAGSLLPWLSPVSTPTTLPPPRPLRPFGNRSPSWPEPAFQSSKPLAIYPAELFPSLSFPAARYTITVLVDIREHFGHSLPSPETWGPVDSER